MLLRQITDDFIKSLKPLLKDALEGSKLTITIDGESCHIEGELATSRPYGAPKKESVHGTITDLSKSYVSMMHFLNAPMPIVIVLKVKDGKLLASNPFKVKTEKVQNDWFVVFTSTDYSDNNFKPLIDDLKEKHLQSRN